MWHHWSDLLCVAGEQLVLRAATWRPLPLSSLCVPLPFTPAPRPPTLCGPPLLQNWVLNNILGLAFSLNAIELISLDRCGTQYTVIWLYFTLKIFRMLLFRVVLISYAPHIAYETRVKILLFNYIRSFNFRTGGSVRN